MGAEPLENPLSLVRDPLDGDDRHCPEHLDPELIRRSEELFRSRFDGVAVFLAGPANVAMQLAWPEVGYGVLESKVASGQVYRHPFKRFRTTIGYIGVAMFGSEAQQAAFRKAIDAAHRQVRSGPDSPVKYNAFNRDLQLWVASCLYYGARDLMVKMHGPMTVEEDELFLRLGGRFGTMLQVPEDMWHPDMDTFWSYWQAGLDRCDIDDAVRDYLLGILRLEILPAGWRPLQVLARKPMVWINAGFLPAEIRAQLGLSWSDRDEARHNRILRIIGRISRPFPGVIRRFPVNAMMLNLDIRRKLGKPLA